MDDRKRKTQSPDAVPENFEIEESNAMKVLRGTGEENENPHESAIGGKKIGRLENFWYLHKWHAGLIIAAAAIIVVLALQIIFHVTPDVYIMYTGPQPIVGVHYERLEKAIVSVMDDTNGDGNKSISFADNMYISPALLRERQAANPSYTIDANANTAAFSRYRTEITAGKHMLCMLDPSLFDEMADAGAFVPLSDIFDDVQAIDCAHGEYGIRLGDTEFYKNTADIQFMPADTVIGVRRIVAKNEKNASKKEKVHTAHKNVLKNIVEFKGE